MRIIAGKFKGLSLYSFNEDNIRPTPDKVRQAIFNTIQFDIAGSSFLDLFAGTGGVSLEAISRGAGYVATVEKDKRSLQLIKKNFNKANASCNLFALDFAKAIKNFSSDGRKFDFIYLDPPFNTPLMERAINDICKHDILKDDGLIICEHEQSSEFTIPERLKIVNDKKYGSVAVTYLRKKQNV